MRVAAVLVTLGALGADALAGGGLFAQDPLPDSLVTTLPTSGTPLAGRRWWVFIWYGILALGLAGLWGAVYWGRRTRWRNLDELFRALGTILVSLGMILLLKRAYSGLEFPLIVVALVCFVAAIIAGRRQHPERERGVPPAVLSDDGDVSDSIEASSTVPRRNPGERDQPFG